MANANPHIHDGREADKEQRASHLVPGRSWLFSRNYVVPESEIDTLGHVNNIKWLERVVNLAGDHSMAWGIDFADLYDLGVYWVVRKHEITYLRAAVAGQKLRESTWLTSMRGIRNFRESRIDDPATGEMYIQAATEWAMIDRVTGKPARMPAVIKERYCVCPEEGWVL